jgi:type IV pilus secretin PilQ/predicted competence protein
MAGMKIRFAGIRNFASIRTKGASLGALLVFLALTNPGMGYAQQIPESARVSQPQSTPAPLPKSSNPGNAAKVTSSGKAAAVIDPGALTDITVQSDDSKVTVTLATDRLLAPQELRVENPVRLVLDFPNTHNKVSFAQLPVQISPLKRIRVQQFQSDPAPIARVVMDLDTGDRTHEINTSKDSVRLVFHKPASKSALPAVAPAPASTSAPKAPDTIAAKPTRAPEPAVKSSFIPTASAAPVEKSIAKAASPAGVSTLKPVGPAAQAPAPSLPATTPSPIARTESVKASPAVKHAVVTPAPRNPVTVVELKPVFPKNEPPKASVGLEPKQLPAEPPAPTPLVAALTPSTMVTPRAATPFGDSKFSGQPLTLDLIDIPLVDFFRLMSEEGGINIVMDPEIKGRVSIKVVKVPWDQIFDAVLTNNSLDKQVEGTVVRIARKATLQDEAKQQESLKKANLLAADLETRIKRLNYAKAALLLKALEDQKTVRGTIVVEERTNSLIVTDLPASITKLIQLIEALDVPQPQVEIEARIVSATRDFARDIGVQFGFVDGNLQRVTVGGPNTFGTIGGTRPSATPTSTYAAGTSTGRGASESTASESAAVSTGTSSNNKGNYNVNLPATKAFGGLGISIGNIFDTFLLDAAITAGESKGLAKLISQPKVTAQNNSSAVITQGLRFPVQIIANNTITVQFQNAALTLTVTPQITYEGNIVLDLRVENNTPDFGRQVNGIPSIRTSESTTRVLVSDGGTTVIGGILIDNESTQEDKVPGLGSLPIIGNLFRRSSVERSTQEVLFFVTPRILK